jgi:hypothetical protein
MCRLCRLGNHIGYIGKWFSSVSGKVQTGNLMKLYLKLDVSFDVPDPDRKYNSTEVDAQIQVYGAYSLVLEKLYEPSFFVLDDYYVVVVQPIDRLGIWMRTRNLKVGRN